MWHVADGKGADPCCGMDEGVPRVVFSRESLQRSWWRGLAGVFAGGRLAGVRADPRSARVVGSAPGGTVGCAGGEPSSRPFQHPVIALNWGRWVVAVPFGRDARPRPRALPVRKDSMAHIPTEQYQPSQLGQTPVAGRRHMACLTLPISLTSHAISTGRVSGSSSL